MSETRWDVNDGAQLPGGNLPESLDKLPLLERQYGMDAGLSDIEHLCKVWAEVGRAILMRRRETE